MAHNKAINESFRSAVLLNLYTLLHAYQQVAEV